jgi:hypothetical protein
MQLAVKQMLKQKSGSVVSISGSLVDNPIVGINASVSMITKGGPLFDSLRLFMALQKLINGLAN